jgi:hypothetical protein
MPTTRIFTGKFGILRQFRNLGGVAALGLTVRVGDTRSAMKGV